MDILYKTLCPENLYLSPSENICPVCGAIETIEPTGSWKDRADWECNKCNEKFSSQEFFIDEKFHEKRTDSENMVEYMLPYERAVLIDHPDWGVTIFVVPLPWAEKYKIGEYNMNEYEKIPEEVRNELIKFPKLLTKNYFFIE